MNLAASKLVRGALIGAVAAGAMALTTASASAAVACNRWGECWHVREHYARYPVGLGIVFHEDGWRGHRHVHWRADRRDDHGYYRNGRWHRF
jgi:hypothetical protein